MLWAQPMRKGLVISVAQACACTQHTYYAHPSLELFQNAPGAASERGFS